MICILQSDAKQVVRESSFDYFKRGMVLLEFKYDQTKSPDDLRQTIDRVIEVLAAPCLNQQHRVIMGSKLGDKLAKKFK